MRFRQLIAVPLLIAGLVAGLAGCGGSAAGDDGIASAEGSTSPSASPSASPSSGQQSADPQELALKFAQCMRDNGIDMPDPDPNSGGLMLGGGKLNPNDPKFQAALEKCRQYAPFGTGGRTFSPDQQQRMLDFAQCMRKNGIDMPDPDPNSGGLMRNGKLNPDDPKFQAAMEACRQYLPQRGNSNSPTPST